jgi:hypothetical protein
VPPATSGRCSAGLGRVGGTETEEAVDRAAIAARQTRVRRFAVSDRIDEDVLRKLAQSGTENERRLAGEALRLRSAIATHASKRGHELCWLNDVALWKTVGIEGDYPHEWVPVREEFLAQCARYHASRTEGTEYSEPAMRAPVTQPKGSR